MILGIESSCDDSSVALFCEKTGVKALMTHAQLDLYELYGGVVPGLAAREHLKHLPILLKKIAENEAFSKVDKVAVTYGPGLAGCLALGIACAKAVAVAKKVPLVGVNHLRGHAFSPFIGLHGEDPENFKDNFKALLPHLGLIAAGGNSTLFVIEENLKITTLAQTIDDAAGEALDKGGKLLGLPYPAGPIIEKLALTGNAKAIAFPVAFPSSSDLKFSFSGLKTSLRYYIEKLTDAELSAQMPDICASYQAAVMQALYNKTKDALGLAKFKSLGLSGGLANNMTLRAKLETLACKREIPFFTALPKHTTDNAAMIAFAAFLDPEGLASGNRLSLDPSLGLA